MGKLSDYGRQALDFIESLEAVKTADAAMDAMADAFATFGFQTLIVTGLPNPDQRFEQVVLAKRWPTEWFKLYTAKRYINVDPVARLCRNSLNPFEWSEAPYDCEREPRAREVMQRAADFNMSNGFIVPIHGSGYEACVSLGGAHLDLNARSKPAIHLMAMYGFDRVRRLLDPGRLRLRHLTARERETLAWASQGKSAWEIGEILGISQRTVEEHLSAAGRKLGAVNRVHAVAISIRERVIEP
jgi:LuxR family transcriptional regulator, quorum-sensing system regulator BjaR1